MRKIDLRGNPLPIPPKILGPQETYKNPGDLEEVLTFYFSLQDEDGSEPLYEAKLLIVIEEVKAGINLSPIPLNEIVFG